MIDLKKYFDKIYCINLDSSTDRWEKTQEEFNKWGITGVERFSAINGEELNIENEKLNPGELGISFSNLKIIEEAKKNKWENVMIFEDDIHFSEEILNLEKYLNELPQDWCLFYLGGMQVGGKIPEIITDNIIRINNTLMIHAFVINHKVYDYLLNEIPRLYQPVDWYYTDIQKKYPCYCTNPYIVFQRAGMSDIQKKHVDYNALFK
jgi:glycosyl transferase family 25